MKKYFFKLFPPAFLFFLLITTEKICAQKKGFKIKPPGHINVQYAGGMGFISIGTGYSTKNEKLDADLFYGYLPESIGGTTIHSISGKITWVPLHPLPIKKYQLEPLMTGLIVNYSFGKQYFSFDPPNYPYRYYSFPTAIHSAIFLGSRVGYNFPPQSFVKRMSFYYEVLSFDREILSFVSNTKSLKVTDIVTLSLGVKINID